MPIIELNEAPTGMTAGGKFTPKADQKKYRSAWAVKGGGSQNGFPGEGDLKQNIPFGHGSTKAISGYERFEEKGGKPNTVHHGGLELVEMIIPKEDAEAKTLWEGDVSKGFCENIKAEQIEKARLQGVKINPEEFKDKIGTREHGLEA